MYINWVGGVWCYEKKEKCWKKPETRHAMGRNEGRKMGTSWYEWQEVETWDWNYTAKEEIITEG